MQRTLDLDPTGGRATAAGESPLRVAVPRRAG